MPVTITRPQARPQPQPHTRPELQNSSFTTTFKLRPNMFPSGGINQVPMPCEAGGQDNHEVIVGSIGSMGIFRIDRRRRVKWSLYWNQEAQ
jgi:hypothetical protein